MTAIDVVFLIVGAVAGYWLGVWRAEIGRWSHSSRRSWQSRASYRKSQSRRRS